MSWIDVIKDLGFPIFVAVFVLVRMEPAIKRLDASITALTIVAAKSNGMKNKDISEVIDAVKYRRKKNKGRRITDHIEAKELTEERKSL